MVCLVGILRRILAYLKPYPRWITLGYLALLISTATQLLTPRLIAYVIDSGIVVGSLRAVVIGAAAIVVAALLQGAFTYLRSYAFQWIAERVAFDIRNDLYRHMERLSFTFFDRAHTGQLMSRATEDVNSIRRFLMMSLRAVVQTIAMLVIVAGILLAMNWRLALISLAVMPVLVWTAVRFGTTIRPKFLAAQQQFGVMTTALQENLSGARVVRSFAREDAEAEKFDATLAGLFDRDMATVRQFSWYFPFTTLLSALGVALVLWYGGHQVVSGALSVGELSAFYFYLTMLGQPIRMLGWVVNSVARALASGERIFDVLDTPPVITSPAHPRRLLEPRGRVEFRDVSFRYPETTEDALHDVSFVAEPGRRIALFGATGSGKSTITALIPRFYDVDAGAVLVDGVDVRDLALTDLRRSIGIVLQDTFLFSVSIRENIRYGRPDAADEEVVAAAKAAQAHDFIAALPDGYDTIVGERGVSLSGGQKQRVAIARALLMNPRILILDDATSSVDTETEYAIQIALRHASAGRTTFIIAHRLVTLQESDLILVLDHGEIVERGTHLELVTRGGLYTQAYELQLKDQEELAAAAD